MPRSLKYEIPGTDWRRGLMDLIDGDVESLFKPYFRLPLHVVVEIGFGRWEFMLDIAAKNTERVFLGVEVSFKRVLIMARKVGRARLQNVRLIEARGEVVVHDCLQAASVDEFWINFSDPWPKAAHARRRVVQPANVAGMARALRPGGVIHIATDDATYAEQIHEVLSAERLLQNLHAPRAWLWEVPDRTPTSYELDWRAEGRSIHYFDYVRSA